MHLLIAAGGEPALPDALARAAHRARGPKGRRLAELSRLLRDHPGAARTIAEVMAEAGHGDGEPDGDPVARWTRIFDSLACRHPAAAVALYSLGDEALLSRATAEIVSWLDGQGLLGSDRAVLDLGCGIGRLARALAPACGVVVGADVSQGMLGEAMKRSGPGTLFVRIGGRDLAAFPDRAFDLVVACDVFPYLVAAGGSVAEDHVADIARVLRPGGHAAILNLSYRGDEPRDRADAAEWGRSAGLGLLLEAERPFASWDGAAWLFRRPS